MYTGVPTIYSAAIQVAQRRGSPHDVYEHSTIHEVLDKIPEATLTLRESTSPYIGIIAFTLVLFIKSGSIQVR